MMADEARCTVNVTIHPWCRDVQRDEAVREYEDGREEPLPTLEEAISRAGQFTPSEAPQGAKCTERDSVTNRRPVDARGGGNVTPDFAEAAKCSPAVSDTGEAQSGMRTERITLEVTHGESFGVSHWSWVTILRLQSGESVRVVDGAMEVAYGQAVIDRLIDECDAAIRERDEAKARLSLRLAGIDVIWSRLLAVGGERDSWKILAEESNARADSLTARVAELEEAAKAAPAANADAQSNHAASAASGWLTAEERGLIEGMMESASAFPPTMHWHSGCTVRDTLRILQSLLARSSPPSAAGTELPTD